jgi:hypothetical protein
MPRDGVARRAGHYHAVRFFNDSAELCEIAASFIAEGLTARQPAVVIATPAHRDGISAQLVARGFDVLRLAAEERLFLLDAHMVLSEFMVDGLPDGTRFRQAVAPLLERAARVQPKCAIRAYGEMVDILWKEGSDVAATRLETLWNDLARTHDFALLCGYSMGHFYKDANVGQVCIHHTHVLSESGEAAPVN